MARGHIKKLVGDRGFGFVRVDGQPDVFFHLSVLTGGVQFEDLYEEQEVEFELDPKAPKPRV